MVVSDLFARLHESLCSIPKATWNVNCGPHDCDPSAGEAVAGRSLGLTCHPG